MRLRLQLHSQVHADEKGKDPIDGVWLNRWAVWLVLVLNVDLCKQGMGQCVAFCGDGLNDLAALGTAEVGMAIGPIDAMAAAPISTRRSSIAGFAHGL